MATVFLDLDGTLVDPKPGITQSVQYTLQQLGLPTPHADDLEWVIGPALVESFRSLGAKNPAKAMEIYRARYSDFGLFQARLYTGISGVLETLFNLDCQLCLATAKPHVYARRITAHFGVSRFLEHEFGPELDGTRSNKGTLLVHALNRLQVLPENSVMVGDRCYDVDAATQVGMRSIGVQWGYGTPEELSGATVVCPHPKALVQQIRDLLDI